MLLVTLSAACGGCSMLRYLVYLGAPTGATQTVEAEFGELAGREVVVVVYADEVTRYEHPAAALDVSYAVADELRKKVAGISVVRPERVAKYQQENLHWDSMDKTVLGKAFGADYVLYVTLVNFSTVEPGSLNLYRGRISCEFSVYDTAKPERQAEVYDGGDMRVVHPPDAPLGRPGATDRAIVQATTHVLAETMIKKFYKHKAPKAE